MAIPSHIPALDKTYVQRLRGAPLASDNPFHADGTVYKRYYFCTAHNEQVQQDWSLKHVDGLHNPLGSDRFLSAFVDEGELQRFWTYSISPLQPSEYIPSCENFSGGWKRLSAGVNMMWEKAILNQNTVSLIQKEIDHDKGLILITRHTYHTELTVATRGLILFLGFGVALRGIISTILSSILCGWVTWCVDALVDYIAEDYFLSLVLYHREHPRPDSINSCDFIEDTFHTVNPQLEDWNEDNSCYEVALPLLEEVVFHDVEELP